MRPLTEEQQKMMDSVVGTKIKKISVVSPDWEFEGQNLSAKVFRRPDSLYVQIFTQKTEHVVSLLEQAELQHEVVPEAEAIASSFPLMSDEDMRDVLDDMDVKSGF